MRYRGYKPSRRILQRAFKHLTPVRAARLPEHACRARIAVEYSSCCNAVEAWRLHQASTAIGDGEVLCAGSLSHVAVKDAIRQRMRMIVHIHDWRSALKRRVHCLAPNGLAELRLGQCQGQMGSMTSTEPACFLDSCPPPARFLEHAGPTVTRNAWPGIYRVRCVSDTGPFLFLSLSIWRAWHPPQPLFLACSGIVLEVSLGQPFCSSKRVPDDLLTCLLRPPHLASPVNHSTTLGLTRADTFIHVLQRGAESGLVTISVM